MATSVWSDDNYVKTYRLRRDGMEARANLAHALGCSPTTLGRWFEAYPALANAWEQGALDRGGATTGRQREYIYQRLPPKLQAVWQELEQLVADPCGARRVEEIFAEGGRRMRMHLFVHALCVGNFNPSIACKFVGISGATLKAWREEPEFAELMDEVIHHKKNFLEGAMMNLVAAGEPAAVLYANKCLNADRGYAPRTTLAVEHTGAVAHNHNLITLERLDPYLDIETKQKILIAMRTCMAAEATPALPGTVVPALAVREHMDEEAV